MLRNGLFGEPGLSPEQYLSWAVNNPCHVRVVEFPVMMRNLPSGVESMLLYDISLIKRGSDEELCRNHPKLWRRVARGNVLLRIIYSENNRNELRFVLQGLRKFAAYETLSSGSPYLSTAETFPDYADPSRNFKCRVCEAKVKTRGPNWPAFFIGETRALDCIQTYVATEKENGEAAHFSVIEVNGDVLYVVGSKNVHMVIRDVDDVGRYEGSGRRLLPDDFLVSNGSAADTHDRFAYARRIASTLMDLLLKDNRCRPIEIMLRDTLTANFELIDPSSRHFVYYDDLQHAELRFIAWTSFALDPVTDGLSRQYLSSLQLAQDCGLKTVQYRTYCRDAMGTMIEENRSRVNSEGLVVYCCDDQGRTIGLWKIKTVWYTMHKCICNQLLRCKNISTIEAKVQEFGRRLQLTTADIQQWQFIGRDFYHWLEKKSLLSVDNLRLKYSTLFSEYEHFSTGS